MVKNYYSQQEMKISAMRDACFQPHASNWVILIEQYLEQLSLRHEIP